MVATTELINVLSATRKLATLVHIGADQLQLTPLDAGINVLGMKLRSFFKKLFNLTREYFKPATNQFVERF